MAQSKKKMLKFIFSEWCKLDAIFTLQRSGPNTKFLVNTMMFGQSPSNNRKVKLGKLIKDIAEHKYNSL